METNSSILEFNIWDLPEDKIYLKIDDKCRVDFLNEAIKISGSWVEFTNFLHITSSSLSYYKNGICLIPLRIIKNTLNLYPQEMKETLISKINENIKEIRVGYGRGEVVKRYNIPRRFTNILSRIAGHLSGDGGIDERGVVYYANKCEVLVEQFKHDLKKEFKNINHSEYIDLKNVKSVRFPRFVGIILQHFFGNMYGQFKHVPEFILNSNKTCKKLFLRALFDDEGSVRTKEHKIEIKMANEHIIKTVKEMLEEFNITTGKISIRKYSKPNHNDQFRLIISGRHNIEIFNKEIGFDHSLKKKKLEISLQNYKNTHYKMEEIRNLMLNILKKNGSMSMYELAKKINRKPHSQLSKILYELEKNGLIISNKVGRGLKIYTISNG